MEIKLIILFILIISILKFNCEKYSISLNNNIPILKENDNNINIIISTYVHNSIYNYSLHNENCTSADKKDNYYYFNYEECKENMTNISLFNNSFRVSFFPVNIDKLKEKIDISYILSLNKLALNSLIILDYINKNLEIYNCNDESDCINSTKCYNYTDCDIYINCTEYINCTDYYNCTNCTDDNNCTNYTNIEDNTNFNNSINCTNYTICNNYSICNNETICQDLINCTNYSDCTNNINCSDLINIDNNFFVNENRCYNHNNSKDEVDRKFVCELDYILFGHEDLKKDDVYLAKEIDEDYKLAYLDNMLNYSIFPEIYLDYFFTSFFSELNDECEINEFTPEDYKSTFYYITCPKKKIDIYTKRRKLSLIINKFSYRIVDLFRDSLDFVEKKDYNNDKYYFNIVFESDRKNFSLGIGFFRNKKIGYFNEGIYIFSKERNNYTDDLTDINSDKFERWLYILTAFSFTFLLLIFTIVGCMHSRKVKQDLKEMLR